MKYTSVYKNVFGLFVGSVLGCSLISRKSALTDLPASKTLLSLPSSRFSQEIGMRFFNEP